ncbi:MAG: hypothetical protein DYG89_35590 [Caldilinea sp. CFX5]|nr:hypothetical protein [Caldilinea sp. CFX5]
MVLDYYQASMQYRQLQRLLKTTADGTPFNNLTLLAACGFSVVVKNEFDQPMALLEAYIRIPNVGRLTLNNHLF